MTRIEERAGGADASVAEQAAYDELRCYTLARGDREFVHQHAAGPERDRGIDSWCSSVWKAFRDSRDAVVRPAGAVRDRMRAGRFVGAEQEGVRDD